MRVKPKCGTTSVLAFCCGAVIAWLVCSRQEMSFNGFLDPKYAIIWSGVFGATIAAIISLIGVRAANRSSLDRLDRQHEHDKAEGNEQRKHDAKQKDEDRKAAIRREVYTKAVEEAHAVLGIIGGLPERPLSESAKDADGLQLFLKANAKVWLVAESEAAHLSRELTNLVGELYFKTIQNAYPLRLAMEAVRNLDRQAVHAESEILRIEMRISEMKEQRADNEKLRAAGESWKSQKDWLRSLKRERINQFSRLHPERLKYTTVMLEEMRPVQRIMVELVSSLIVLCYKQ